MNDDFSGHGFGFVVRFYLDVVAESVVVLCFLHLAHDGWLPIRLGDSVTQKVKCTVRRDEGNRFVLLKLVQFYALVEFYIFEVDVFLFGCVFVRGVEILSVSESCVKTDAVVQAQFQVWHPSEL